MGDPRFHLEPEPREVFGDHFGRPDLAIRELGVLVDVPAPLDHLGHHRGHSAVDLGAEARLSGHRRREHGGKEREDGNSVSSHQGASRLAGNTSQSESSHAAVEYPDAGDGAVGVAFEGERTNLAPKAVSRHSRDGLT
jgi:hypothetical protein